MRALLWKATTSLSETVWNKVWSFMPVQLNNNYRERKFFRVWSKIQKATLLVSFSQPICKLSVPLQFLLLMAFLLCSHGVNWTKFGQKCTIWSLSSLLSHCLFCLLSIPFYQTSDSNWSQSQEALSTGTSGRGKTVFSLGLGITGPDMLAAARGGR